MPKRLVLLLSGLVLVACGPTPTPAPTSTPMPTNTPKPLATPTSAPTSTPLTETIFVESVRKMIFRDWMDAQNSKVGDEDVWQEIARQWGITVDTAKTITAEGVEKGWLTPMIEATPTLGPPTATPVPTLAVEERLAQSLHELWAAKEWETVIGLINQILAINPSYDDMTEKLYAAHVNYGQHLVAEGRLEEAKMEFTRALNVKPDRGEAVVELAALAGETPRPLPVVLPGEATPTPQPVKIPSTFIPPTPVSKPTPTPTFPPPPSGVILVPAGEFIMGSPSGEGLDNERPQHTVYLDAFYIGKYEVTNAEYKECVDAGACRPPSENSSSTRDFYYGNPEYDNYPVIYVSWYDAKAYCEWKGMRLPTEAEWEKACRGTDGRKSPWGNELDSDKCNCTWSPIIPSDTTEVGSYPDGASPYGAMNMAGNVSEWVADWYNEDFYKEWVADWYDEDYYNPQGPTSGENRVWRGGSWDSSLTSARCAGRSYPNPNTRYYTGGFRCAASPSSP